jgi:hypothetical protein
MKVSRTAAAAFTAEFDSEEELRREHQTNLMHGALRLPTNESVALHATLLVTLRGPFGAEAFAKATVVAALPDGIALAIEGDAEERLQRLLAGDEVASAPAVAEEPDVEESEEKRQNAWDRMRGLSQMEKLLLAVKAERSERALLLQDNDPRVLLSLLRNPRVTVDEIARVAKSAYLNYQIAEVILKTTQWMSSIDVRLALIRNPKTPEAFALRILPTLPEIEIRAIARGGMTMALKQAALRRLQGR